MPEDTAVIISAGGICMKVERVDENKIKVLIDNDEAREMNITPKMISENTPEVQKMFWQAIHMAEENGEFSIDGAKLFVETIPSYEDGIGMLITRVCSEEELSRAIDNCSYKGKIRRSRMSMTDGTPRRRRKYIYRFRDFEAVCSAVERLRGRYAGRSTLYKMDGMFYLYLVPEDALSAYDADLILPEFSHKVPHGQYVHGKLNEYGEVMIEENSLEVLLEYFCHCV